jgi:hypothetical protein
MKKIDGSYQTYPMISCDYCGRRIENAGHGNVVFSKMEEGDIPYKTVHKMCDKMMSKSTEYEDLSMNLDTFLAYLLTNVKLTNEKLEKAR